jgi:hypothetical protein
LRGVTPCRRASYAFLIVLVLAAAMTAGCNANTASSLGDQSAKTSNSRNSASTSGPEGMVRLGCGEYCLQAGGYGGGGTPNMTKILTTKVTALPDGTVAITVECLFQQPCRGALLLGSGDNSTASVCQTPAVVGSQVVWWGQSDLDVPAQMTRILGVTLSPCAFGLLSQRGTLHVLVTADSSQTLAGLSPTDRQGLIPIESELITVSGP